MNTKLLIAITTACFFTATIASAQQGAVVTNQQSSIDVATGYDWYELNNCTGEHVDIVNGIWEFNTHIVIIGNRISFTETSNVPNYRLVSSSGIEYTGVYASTLHVTNAWFENGVYTANRTTVAILITAGSGNNSKLLIDEHITINTQGVLTRVLDNFRVVCF